MSWTKKILRVNLTNGTCETEPLNMDWAKLYLGQRGLATKYYVEECDQRLTHCLLKINLLLLLAH